jgi:hypothetical protein
VEAHCGLLFTTGQGNISQVAKVTQQIFKEHEPPMPFDFMHITNNMAPFYVAQGLGLTSSNLTIAHRAFPFETAMDLAAFQTRLCNTPCLIGTVDECAFPLSEHRQRLALPPGTPLAEGSHWLLLGSEPDHAIARMEFCDFCDSKKRLLDQLLHLPLLQLVDHELSAPVWLSFGFAVDNEEQQWWQNQLNIQQVYDYRQLTAYHDTAAAYGMTSFIERYPKQTVIHINRSSQQRYAVLCITVL